MVLVTLLWMGMEFHEFNNPSGVTPQRHREMENSAQMMSSPQGNTDLREAEMIVGVVML